MTDGPGKRSGGAAADEVIVEFHRVGNAVKVSAVDTRTYEEVSIVAPAHSTEREMTDAVLRKLAWVQARGPERGAGGAAARGARPRR